MTPAAAQYNVLEALRNRDQKRDRLLAARAWMAAKPTYETRS